MTDPVTLHRALKEVADRVYHELVADGYGPRMHARDEGGPFEIRLRGDDFDLGDFKALVRVSEQFGLGLKLDSHGWITLGSPA